MIAVGTRADGRATNDDAARLEVAPRIEALERAVAELERELAEREAHIEALIERGRRTPVEEGLIRDRLRTVQDQLVRRDAELIAALGVGRGGTATQPIAVRHAPDLIERVRATVDAALPVEATTLVISHGDPTLLLLGQRRAWHFPRDASGAAAPFSIVDGAAAITHLESLVKLGARYLVVPTTGVGWIMAFPEFKSYLERTFQLIVRRFETCLIFGPRPRE